MRERVAALPVKSAIIDAELVACDAEGRPDFRPLLSWSRASGTTGGQHSLVLWCFDLVEIDGTDLRSLSLVTRRARLKAMLKQADDACIRTSDTFKNPETLLAACDERGLEGIVSKKAGQPYVSGNNRGWIKVKCHEWRAANAGRWEMFAKT
jgi:bifunctional non-homologous end joining protein LigD